MKKLHALVALLLVAAMLLPMSCLAEDSLRFSWWGVDSRHVATLSSMDIFTKKTGIPMVGEYGGWDGYLEKIVTQIAAKTAPDIMQTDYAFLEPFWQQMDSFVDFKKQDVVDLSIFSEGMLKGITAPGGELIGLPTGMNFNCNYANMDLASKVGIDVTKVMTWDDLLEYGRKVQAYDPNCYLIGSFVLNRWLFEPYLFNITGNPLILDDYTLGFTAEQATQAFKYIKQLYDEKVIQPYEEEISVTASYENPAWLDKRVVIVCEWASVYASAMKSLGDTKVSVIYPFGDPEAKNTGFMLRPTNMLTVSAFSDKQNEALQYINSFFNDDEMIDALAMERAMPATEKGIAKMTEEGKLTSDLTAIAKYTTDHKGGMGQNIISSNNELWTIECDLIASLYYNDITAEQAGQQMYDSINNWVKDYISNKVN